METGRIVFFDAHTHLCDACYSDSLSEILKRSQEAGVDFISVCGTKTDEWHTCIELVDSAPVKIAGSIGIHPWFVRDLPFDWFEVFTDFLSVNKIGVGEIGLDFYDGMPPRDLQIEIFTKQLSEGLRRNLPVTIHCRKAWAVVYDILKMFLPHYDARVCIHSYSGDAGLVSQFEKLGCFLSFSASLTNTKNKKVRKSAIAVSENRLLLETDSPALLCRTLSLQDTIRCNEPAFISHAARVLAELRNVSLEHIAEVTLRNGLTMFERIV